VPSRGAVKCNAGLIRDASYGTGGVLGQLADDTLERERRGARKEKGGPKAGPLVSPIERRVGPGRVGSVPWRIGPSRASARPSQ
jgi:hypothetical protein